MKKLSLFFILSVITMLISCSKKDDPKTGTSNFEEENPLQGYLSNTGFNQKTTELEFQNSGEIGYGFIPKVKGKINAFVVKIPAANTTLKITLWDIATQTAIKTETVSVSAGTELVKTITPIELTKDKEYGITINTVTFYNNERNDGSVTTYPLTVGNLSITGFAFVQTAAGATTFPTTEDNSSYAGDVSFKFQRTE